MQMTVRLTFQSSLYFINRNHFFFEGVRAGFRRLNGFNDFGECLTVVLRLQGCNYLFCHDSVQFMFFGFSLSIDLYPIEACINGQRQTEKLFDFFMNRNFFKERIVFLPFDTSRGIFPVFRRYIPGHAGNTARLLLGAFQNNLDSIGAFLCHRS